VQILPPGYEGCRLENQVLGLQSQDLDQVSYIADDVDIAGHLTHLDGKWSIGGWELTDYRTVPAENSITYSYTAKVSGDLFAHIHLSLNVARLHLHFESVQVSLKKPHHFDYSAQCQEREKHLAVDD